MFENYDNPFPATQEEGEVRYKYSDIPPFPIYNARGQLKGYFWNYGDTLQFSFSPYKVIKVEEDSLIFDRYDEFPSSSDIGIPGQKAYNTESAKSWTCVGPLGLDEVEWEEDKFLSYPEDGTKEISIRLGANDSNRMLVEVFNFRWEKFHSFETTGNDITNSITIDIDKELSSKFVPGIYYFIFKTISDLNSEVVNKVLFLVK